MRGERLHLYGPSTANAVCAESLWRPRGRAGVALLELQLLRVPLAVAVATMSPSGRAPSKISTVTSEASLAVPENDGVVSLDLEGRGASLTVGARVSTSKLTGLLAPVLLTIELSCEAMAV